MNPSITECPACKRPLKNKEPDIRMGVCCFCGTVLVILSEQPLKMREALLNDLIDLTPEVHASIDLAQQKARSYEVEPGNPS